MGEAIVYILRTFSTLIKSVFSKRYNNLDYEIAPSGLHEI